MRALIVAIAAALSGCADHVVIELDADKWECSKSEHRMLVHLLPVGKVMVPQPITYDVCVEYRMK